MILRLILITFCLLSLPMCSVKKNPSSGTENSEPEMNEIQKKTKKTIYFKEGENQFLKEYEMNVTFKKIVEDSRCPKEVNCVWSGVATAEIELMGTYTRPVIVKLSTLNNPEKGYQNRAVFNGYQISLVTVNPYPISGSGLTSNSGKYTIGLRFDKIAGNQIEPNIR